MAATVNDKQQRECRERSIKVNCYIVGRRNGTSTARGRELSVIEGEALKPWRNAGPHFYWVVGGGMNRKTQAGKDCLPKAVTFNAEVKKQRIFSAPEVSCNAGTIQLQPAGCFKI